MEEKQNAMGTQYKEQLIPKEEGSRAPRKYFIENMHSNSVLQFLMGVKGSGWGLRLTVLCGEKILWTKAKRCMNLFWSLTILHWYYLFMGLLFPPDFKFLGRSSIFITIPPELHIVVFLEFSNESIMWCNSWLNLFQLQVKISKFKLLKNYEF